MDLLFFKLQKLYRCAILNDECNNNTITGAIGLNDYFLSFYCISEIINFKRDMRNFLNEIGQIAIHPVSHPLNSIGIGLVIRTIKIKSLNINFILPRCLRRYTGMMIFHGLTFSFQL